MQFLNANIRTVRPMVAAALLALTGSAPALAQEQLTGGDFEAPVTGTFSGTVNGTGFVYPGDGVIKNGWRHSSNSGLINGSTGTPWFGGLPPAGFGGAQYAFVQSNLNISQGFTSTASGIFTLSWLESARPRLNPTTGGDQSYRVWLGSTDFGLFTTTSGQAFQQRTLNLGQAMAGGFYTLMFEGLFARDDTVFLDNVSLSVAAAPPPGIPEPGNWALLLAGFGLTGAVARRRRSALIVAA